MKIPFKFDDEISGRIRTVAQLKGLTPDEFIVWAVEEALHEAGYSNPPTRDPAVRREAWGSPSSLPSDNLDDYWPEELKD